jgi:hypothetical protein
MNSISDFAISITDVQPINVPIAGIFKLRQLHIDIEKTKVSEFGTGTDVEFMNKGHMKFVVYDPVNEKYWSSSKNEWADSVTPHGVMHRIKIGSFFEDGYMDNFIGYWGEELSHTGITGLVIVEVMQKNKDSYFLDFINGIPL